MQTFEFKNDLEGNRSSYKFNRRVVKFGDGYEQRVSHGINSKSGEWNYQRTAKFEEVERIADFSISIIALSHFLIAILKAKMSKPLRKTIRSPTLVGVFRVLARLLNKFFNPCRRNKFRRHNPRP